MLLKLWVKVEEDRKIKKSPYNKDLFYLVYTCGLFSVCGINLILFALRAFKNESIEARRIINVGITNRINITSKAFNKTNTVVKQIVLKIPAISIMIPATFGFAKQKQQPTSEITYVPMFISGKYAKIDAAFPNEKAATKTVTIHNMYDAIAPKILKTKPKINPETHLFINPP